MSEIKSQSTTAPPGPLGTTIKTTKTSTQLPPCISIFVDGDGDGGGIDEKASSSELSMGVDDYTNDLSSSSNNNNNSKMIKCKSMQNMKLVNNSNNNNNGGLIENERYKQNLDQFNNGNTNNLENSLSVLRATNGGTITNQVIPVINSNMSHTKTTTTMHHHAIVPNYRKCLSRVNLNLYTSATPMMVHSSSHHDDAAASGAADDDNDTNQRHPGSNKPKFIKVNPIRAVKVRLYFLLLFLKNLTNQNFQNMVKIF